jgi:hypothetical protein
MCMRRLPPVEGMRKGQELIFWEVDDRLRRSVYEGGMGYLGVVGGVVCGVDVAVWPES